MSNIVEFVVRMKDLMSGGLGKLGSTSQTAFNKMAQHADKVNQRNRVLGSSFDELQKKIRDVENTIRTSTVTSQIREARRELASLQRQSNRHAGNLNQPTGKSGLGVSGIMTGNIAADLAMNAAGIVKDLVIGGISAGISGSMKKEQDITGLTTFLGAEEANKAYNNIRQDASVSPYGTDSLLEVNRSLISAGLNAKDAREDTMNLANAISAVGGGNAELSRMAANMQQIKTVGKASSIDIKQFGMVGINIYEMLAKSTGKSIKEVQEMDVTYDQLAKSLAMARSKGGIYEGALDAQGATRGAKLEQIKDQFGNALTDIADAFSPVIGKVVDVGIKVAESIGPMLEKAQPYIDMISNGLGQAIDYVLSISSSTSEWGDWLEIATNYYSVLWDFIKQLFSVVWKIVGGVIEWAAKSEIIKDIVRVVHWVLEKVYTLIGWIGDALIWIWDNVLKPILDGLDTAYKWIKDFLGDDNTVTVSVKTPDNNPFGLPISSAPAPTSYQADLTRFKDKGLIADTDEKSKKNKASSKKTGDTISGGGPRVINITLGKFFETIQFTTMNNTESKEELEKLLMELMGRVLYNGAKIG